MDAEIYKKNVSLKFPLKSSLKYIIFDTVSALLSQINILFGDRVSRRGCTLLRESVDLLFHAQRLFEEPQTANRKTRYECNTFCENSCGADEELAKMYRAEIHILYVKK